MLGRGPTTAASGRSLAFAVASTCACALSFVVLVVAGNQHSSVSPLYVVAAILSLCGAAAGVTSLAFAFVGRRQEGLFESKTAIGLAIVGLLASAATAAFALLVLLVFKDFQF